jgi:ribonuclease J
VIPLGGLGEIGMNCMALEVGGEILVIDCGVTFPRVDLGIDTYRPDMTWLEEHRDAIRGLVITHGHEDHIGAVPYFVDRFDVPVWGPAYALELIKLRLEEQGFRQGSYDLRPALPRGRFAVGGFEVEPIRVTHSISEATALVVRTSEGVVVHTGDFKLDAEPCDGEMTDIERFSEVGKEGVRLLLSDSTNIDSPGTSGSESRAVEALSHVIDSAPGRVVVGMFASNVPRMAALGELALRSKRKVVLFGRSVQTHVRLGREHGQITWPSDLVVTPEVAMSLPRKSVLAIATGTQAERLAALWRMSVRAHPQLTLEPGDRVIFSSRLIPGNEPAVTLMTNGFLRHGIEVRTAVTDPGVHVSGHAYRDEQARMIDLVQPQGFLPIHGSLMHLHRHAELARTKGVREVVVLENGEIGEFGANFPLVKGPDHAQAGKIATWGGDDIPERVLTDREGLARSGIAFVTVLVDSRGKPTGPGAVATRGVLDELEDAAVLRETAREVHRALADRTWPRDRPSDEEVAELARTHARRRLEQAVGRRPLVVAQVVRAR